MNIMKEWMKKALAVVAVASMAAVAQAQTTATMTIQAAAPAAVNADGAKTAADILAVVGMSASHKTLASLLKDEEVAKAVLSAKSMTLFAPTDEAFAKVPKADLNALAADKKTLITVLSGHVLTEAVMSDKLTSPTVKTEAKTELAVKKVGDTLTVGGAKVLKADIKATNGVVYSIDAVLLPKAAEAPMGAMKMDMKMTDAKTTAPAAAK